VQLFNHVQEFDVTVFCDTPSTFSEYLLNGFSVKIGRKDNRPSANGQAPWAQDKDTSIYKQPNNGYGAGLIVPAAAKENVGIARQPSMKPVARQEAPWAQDDSEPSRAMHVVPKKDAPWAQDEESAVYRKPENGYGAGLDVRDPRPSEHAQAPRRAQRAQDQQAPWAQDRDDSVYRPAVNGYGAGVQAGGGPPQQIVQHGRRAANRGADIGGNSESAAAYMAPANGYGAAQEDGGLQAHLDAKQSARAIRTKMTGAGNVLSWS
jgi:hypothetical protein